MAGRARPEYIAPETPASNNDSKPCSLPPVVRKWDRIAIDPAIMNGQPCIRGMRLTVRRVVEAVALYPDRTELRAEYPELRDEDIAQALSFEARSL